MKEIKCNESGGFVCKEMYEVCEKLGPIPHTWLHYIYCMQYIAYIFIQFLLSKDENICNVKQCLSNCGSWPFIGLQNK